MNRIYECTQYKVREELEDVLSPWPMKESPKRTLSDLEVISHGANLPRAFPDQYSEEVEMMKWQHSPLKTKYLLENQKNLGYENETWMQDVIQEGLKALVSDAILPPQELFDEILVHDEEPDDTWAMLDSENEARYQFEGFLKRMRLHYSDYVKSGDEKTYEQPSYEIPPIMRDTGHLPYHDPRCDDKRKMLPQVYEAPPYPEYWLLKKQPRTEKLPVAEGEKEG